MIPRPGEYSCTKQIKLHIFKEVFMKSSQKKERNLLSACLLSQAVWFISALVLLLVMCAVAYSTRDPDAITEPLSMCALYLSAVIGGVAAVKFSGDGIVSGLISGGITALFVVLLSCLPLPESGFDLTHSLIFTALVIPASALGALIGRRRRKNVSPMKKNRVK